MRFVHFYPFPPWHAHGGTLRLKTAVAATVPLGETVVYWWDAGDQKWVVLTDVADVAGPPPDSPTSTQASASRLNWLKRKVFPATLWASGRPAVKAAAAGSFVDPSDSVILHTTYLAPLVPKYRDRAAAVTLDVYDLVWRAHAMDAAALRMSNPVRAFRWLYSRTVRYREERFARHANALVVAGWTDRAALNRSVGGEAHWVPTGLETAAPLPTPAGGTGMRVGFIGNFSHSATTEAAEQLVTSPLAASPDVQIVLAGLGSERWLGTRAAIAFGPVATIEDFYNSIDAVVVPVTNGAGMKCKLAEAVLAGKLTVTTPSGVEGFPAEISQHFVCVNHASELTPALLRDALQRFDAEAASEAFSTHISAPRAAATYRAALPGLLPASP